MGTSVEQSRDGARSSQRGSEHERSGSGFGVPRIHRRSPAQQEPDHLGIAAQGRIMQGRGTAPIQCLDVGAAVEQQFYYASAAFHGSIMEERTAAGKRFVDIQTAVEQQSHNIRLVLFRLWVGSAWHLLRS